jgi:beta-1,2-mannosidase
MKRTIAFLAIVFALVAAANSLHSRASYTLGVPNPHVDDASSDPARVPSWGIGPFVRDEGADFIRITPNSVFQCPVKRNSVHWEDQAVLCAAAIVRDGKVYVLYRAEDSTLSQPAAGKYHWGTSRIGIATSEDGRHFKRYPEPVLYPSNDEMKDSEWPGGCQDPRIVEASDGTYVMTYTAYDGKFPRLAIATSKDLFHWKKQGLAFRNQLGGRFCGNFRSKSGSIVCKRDGGRFIAEKIKGKYWMYFGEFGIMLASSKDLIDWEIVLDEKGADPLIVAPMRKGGQWFDQGTTECGSQAFITSAGIFMIYDGMAPQRPDLALTGRIWSAGQILFDLKEVGKVIGRTDRDFFHPEKDYEKQNITRGTGGANNVTFVSNLIFFGGKWRFYYGCADSRVACAVSTR